MEDEGRKIEKNAMKKRKEKGMERIMEKEKD